MIRRLCSKMMAKNITVPTTFVKFDFQSTADYIPGPDDGNVSLAIWEKWTAMLPSAIILAKDLE